MAGSSFVLLSAVAMALKDTLSKAASMSRNTPRTYPFLAMRRSIMWVTLWRAASVEHPLLKPNCRLLVSCAILRSFCMCQRITFSWSLSRTGERVMVL